MISIAGPNAGDATSPGKGGRPDSRPSELIPGLRNLGNTCFLNAVLQALAACPAVLEHLDVVLGPGTDPERETESPDRQTAAALACVLRELGAGEEGGPQHGPAVGGGRDLVARDRRGTIEPKLLASLLRSHGGFVGGCEHDAAEALDWLLETTSRAGSQRWRGTGRAEAEREGMLLVLEGRATVRKAAGARSGCGRGPVCEAAAGTAGTPAPTPVPPEATGGTMGHGSREGDASAPGRVLQAQLASPSGSTADPSGPSGACVPGPSAHGWQAPARAAFLGTSPYLSVWRSLARLPCEGTQVQTLRCLSCHSQLESSASTFRVLAASVVPPEGGGWPLGTPPCLRSIKSALADLFAAEIVSGYRCQACDELAARAAGEAPGRRERGGAGEHSERRDGARLRPREPPAAKTSAVIKQVRLGMTPAVLLVQVARVAWDGLRPRKVGGYAPFPAELDLGALALSWGDGELAVRPRAPSEPSVRYALTAVVEHVGGAESGHYATWRRVGGPGSPTWARTSDDQVRPASLSEALRAEAAVLVYERKHPSDPTALPRLAHAGFPFVLPALAACSTVAASPAVVAPPGVAATPPSACVVAKVPPPAAELANGPSPPGDLSLPASTPRPSLPKT